MRNVIAWVIVALLISGCATSGKFKRNMDTWLGGDINRAIMQFGPPSNTYSMPNGQSMYTWLWVGNTVITTNYNYYSGMVRAGAQTYWCEVNFTASGSRIEHYRFYGNSCRSR